MISERATDDPIEFLMTDQIRRYTKAFENAQPFLIVGGKVHNDRWRGTGFISRVPYFAVSRKGVAEFVSHFIYFVFLVLVGAHLIKRKPNIRFVTNPYGHYTLGTLAVVIARITGRKAVVRVASSVSEISARPQVQFKFAYPMLARLEQFAFDHADAIVRISKMPLEPKYDRKTFYIPNLIMKPYGSISRRFRAANSVLFVGRLEPEKGPGVLIDAAGILLEKRRKIEVTIVGEGGLETKLRTDLERKGLSGHVVMEGYVARSRILNMMRRATLLVVPSISEYAPNVVVEAAFNGLPVVATLSGGVEYMIQNRRTGILVSPRNPHALANGIEELLRNSRLRKKIAASAAKRVKKEFSPKRARLAAERMLKQLFKAELRTVRQASGS